MTIEQVSSDAALYKTAIATLSGVIVVLSGVVSFLFFALQKAHSEFRKAQEARLMSAEDHEKELFYLKDMIAKLRRRGKL